jgi:hypothetical protein
LPPKQSSDYQVEVGGEIRLAGHGRARCGAHYKQATPRQRTQVPAGKVTKAPFDRIPHYRGPDRLADDETHPGRIAAARTDQQMTGD